MRKILIGICSMIVFSGCHMLKTNKPSIQHSANNNICCTLPEFNKLVISGNTKVELTNGNYSMQLLKTHGKSLVCPTQLTHKTLYVHATEDDSVITISAPQLHKIIVADRAILSSQNFSTGELTIIARNAGNIDLNGELEIKKIVQEGDGRINISWVNSQELMVTGKHAGIISLAGRVNNLQISMQEHSALYAHYLRTQQTRAFTADNAWAEVWAAESLIATARGNSNIHYYNKPTELSIATKNQGKVLYPYDIR